MPTRYERPMVEVEFVQPILTQDGCCRYVPAVLRICRIPAKTTLTVIFARVRPPESTEEHPQNYEVHPTSYTFRNKTPYTGSDYQQYAAAFVARPHETETGTISIKLESQSWNVLVEAIITFDSRCTRPTVVMQKGRFEAMRFLPELRSEEERNALNGRYPLSLSPTPAPVAPGDPPAVPIPLFPVE